MSATDIIKNEVRVTGVMTREAITLSEVQGVKTLKISSNSYGYDATSSEHNGKVAKRESLIIELQGSAAIKADDFARGDIVFVEGYLSNREWLDKDKKRVQALVVVVDNKRNIHRIGRSESRAERIESGGRNGQ